MHPSIAVKNQRGSLISGERLHIALPVNIYGCRKSVKSQLAISVMELILHSRFRFVSSLTICADISCAARSLIKENIQSSEWVIELESIIRGRKSNYTDGLAM